MIVGSAILTKSSGLFGWAGVDKIENFSLGDADLNHF